MYTEKFIIDGYWLSKRRNSNNWCTTWFCKKDRQTKRTSLGTADFELAKKNLAHFVVLNATLNKVEAQQLPLATIFSRYYERHAKNIRSADTTKRALNTWLDYWQESCVSDLTRVEQDRYIAHLKSLNFSAGYIRRIMTVGKAALNHSVEYGELEFSPKIIMPKELGGKRTERLTTLQASKLFKTANEKGLSHIYDFLMISFNTAARPEAILELTYEQIDLKRRQINFNQKDRIQTKKMRPTVPISNNLNDWLKRRSFVNSEHVISWHGKPIKSIKKAFRSIRDHSQLPDWVCPYIIRHTVAQRLRDEGVAFENIQGFLGHTIKGSTSTYAAFNPEKQMKTIETLDIFMREIKDKEDI